MTKKFVSDCKSIDWQKVIDICESLDDLNDSQFRFLKGRFIELVVENQSNGLLKYVGNKHQDYICERYNLKVELKSVTSQQLYKKDKTLRKSNTIILNNSMGTNSKNALDPKDVADYLIVVKSDGAVLVDKQTILDNATSNGDGFIVKLEPEHVVELSGMLGNSVKYNIKIKDKVDTLLKAVIDHLGKINV
jgi:hypothetical protein